jgi:hypothetical protein
VKQVREDQPRRSCADDAYLGAHGCFMGGCFMRMREQPPGYGA